MGAFWSFIGWGGGLNKKGANQSGGGGVRVEEVISVCVCVCVCVWRAGEVEHI